MRYAKKRKKILHQRYRGNHGRRSRRWRWDSIFADGEYIFPGAACPRCAVRLWCIGGQFTALDFCECWILESESRSEWCWHSRDLWTHRVMGVMEWRSNAVRWSWSSATPAVSCFQTIPALVLVTCDSGPVYSLETSWKMNTFREPLGGGWNVLRRGIGQP